MEQSTHYYRDHLIAKCIVYVLYLMVGIASIESANPYVALVCGTFIWLFGINTIAYMIETVAGHRHSHRPV